MNLTAITDKEGVYLKHFSIPLHLLFITTSRGRYPFAMLGREQGFRAYR